MSPSTYRGRTLEAATRAAHEALGEAAQIVATRKIALRSSLPFLASFEFEVTAEPAEAHQARPDARHTFAAAVRLPGDSEVQVSAIRSEVRGEIRALRAMLAQRMTDDDDGRASRREFEAEITNLQEIVETFRYAGEELPPSDLRRILATAGIEGAAAHLVAKRVRNRGDGASLQESYRQALLETLDIGRFPLADAARKIVVALIGPSGVGKTTTAAKLAAHAVLAQGRSVTLVSTDTFRVGAREQLERFAELLGATFVTTHTRGELDVALASSKSDVTIVDTAGRGPTERDAIETALCRTRLPAGARPEDRHILLCVPAALRELEARRFARAFAACRPTGVVVTKIDETDAPSGLLHGPLAAKVPLAAMCFGQRVPEDIDEASHHAALAALCPPRRPSRARTSAT